MTYVAALDRYDGTMPYRRCGNSGLKLPEISLGLWPNFGGETPLESQRVILPRAFDLGVRHFDLALGEIAASRGQSLAQFALSWVLRDERVTSALIGASSVAQLEENLAAAGRSSFTADELAAIDKQAVEAGINIWARSSES
jgi:aryl-alcohol dehydrogenase-like predicted oxidoreductase